MKTIFVAIASFCDTECAPTIADMFAKAAHPERISVGICWQYDPETQPMLCSVDKANSPRVRQYAHHYRTSRGAGWARNHAHLLHDGEDFILQIDSHMRFMPGWDAILLEQYELAAGEKKVISAFCTEYFPDKPIDYVQKLFPMYRINLFADNSPQIVHLCGTRLGAYPSQPFLSPTLIFNFVFAPKEAFHAAPIDPHIYFKGAETTQAARFWTHGYDIYQPSKVIAFHRWDVPKALYKSAFNTSNELVKQRVFHILDIEPAKDPRALVDIERYGLGTARSIKDYFKFFGVDLQQQTISERGLKGQWDEKVFPEIIHFSF